MLCNLCTVIASAYVGCSQVGAAVEHFTPGGMRLQTMAAHYARLTDDNPDVFAVYNLNQIRRMLGACCAVSCFLCTLALGYASYPLCYGFVAAGFYFHAK